MADTVTKVTRQSWGSRLAGSLGGVLVGLALVVGGVVLLFWNEGRAVDRRKTLAAGAEAVVAADAARPDPGHEGRLVHLTGEATTPATVEDDRLGVRVQALKLRREVEMYQWVERSESETRTKLGGGTETVTTYRYAQEWRRDAVDSSRFEEPAGHANPAPELTAEEWTAEPVLLGAFTLSAPFVDDLDRGRPLAVDDGLLRRIAGASGRPVRREGDGLYLGDDPAAPAVGDLRVRFTEVPPATVSVVGRQQAGVVVPEPGAAGGSIALVAYGAVPAAEMFQTAQAANRTLAWILRFVGFLALAIGLRLVLRPLSVAADVLPPAGKVVAAGAGFFSFVLAAGIALVVIAIGWVAARPLLAVGLLVLAVACGVLLVRRLRRPGRAAPPPVPAAN
jgi:hypothetical protein